MTVYLETDRLRLRKLRQDDLDPFATLNADDKAMKYFPAANSRTASSQEPNKTHKKTGLGFMRWKKYPHGVLSALSVFPGYSFRRRLRLRWRPDGCWRFQPGDKVSRQRPQPPVLQMGFRPLACAKLYRSHRTRINHPSP
jgi:hypothetical protein